VGGVVPLTRRATALCVAALAGALAVGCASTLRSEELPGAAEPLQISKLAVAPFSASPRVARLALQDGGEASAADLVSRHIAEAIATSGIPIVAPEDMDRALAAVEERRGASYAREAARRAWQEFGANAVLLGEVTRYQERGGEALGTSRPAGVGFEVTLASAPDGAVVWRGVFDETQELLTTNLFNAFRYPHGGTRWLTAEEISRWGAGEVARRIARKP
jgi:hypothetical protein